LIEIPYHKRLELAKDFIKPGAVFRIHTTKTKPFKIKYHIILLKTKGEVKYVFSNSVIRAFQRKDSHFLNLQIEVSKDSESCFDENCFIDCARIQTKSFEEIAHQIAQNFQTHKGMISEEIAEKMKQAVQADNKLLSKIDKSYFSSL